MTNAVMQIHPVRTRAEHLAAVKRIEALIDAGVKPGTREGAELTYWPLSWMLMKQRPSRSTHPIRLVRLSFAWSSRA